MRSTSGSQTSTRCSTTTRVAPVDSSTRAAASRTSITPSGSRFAVGSSSSRSPGRIASTPASARRCFWPPESVEVDRSSPTSRPTASRAPCTRRQVSSRGTPRFSQPKATSSPTLARMTWLSGSCSTSPACPRASAEGRPSMSSSPSASPSSLPPSTPASAWSRVDLPAPDAPSSSTRSPGSICRSRSRTAQRSREECRQPQPRALTRAAGTGGRSVIVRRARSSRGRRRTGRGRPSWRGRAPQARRGSPRWRRPRRCRRGDTRSGRSSPLPDTRSRDR